MSTSRTYSKASPETWELVRAAYLSGLSAAVVARRFGVTLSALRKRASRDGWTKLAHARAKAGSAAPGAFDPIPRQLNLNPEVLVRTALEEAARAMADGQPYAARASASAGEAMARLVERYPRFEEAESVSDGQARHDYMIYAVQDLAIELAHRMVRGEPIPAVHAQAYETWKRGVDRRPKTEAGGQE